MNRNKIAIIDLGGTIVDEKKPIFHTIDQKIIDQICSKTIDIKLLEKSFSEILIQFNIEIAKQGSEQKNSKLIIEEVLKKYSLPLSCEIFEEIAWLYLGGENTSYLQPLPGSIELLQLLNSEKFKIIALSNTTLPLSILEKIFMTHSIYNFFSCFILSSECGYKKPSDEIFNHVEKTQNIKLDDYVISIGNSYYADIEPSLKRGYKSYYLEEFAQIDICTERNDANLQIVESLEFLLKDKSNISLYDYP
jgi:FMN phosphatase YigB (HAD superfamily)